MDFLERDGGCVLLGSSLGGVLEDVWIFGCLDGRSVSGLEWYERMNENESMRNGSMEHGLVLWAKACFKYNGIVKGQGVGLICIVW